MAVHLAKERASIVRPPAHRDLNVEKVLAGATVDEILRADDAAAGAFRWWERQEQLHIAASTNLPHTSRDTFATIRDGLIAGPLRQAVAALLTKATALAQELAAFAPGFDAGEILDSGTPVEIDAYRDSRQLQSHLETLTAAWKASWMLGAPLDYRPGSGRPGGHLCWVNPGAVRDVNLRDGRDAEILRIATAGSEYRLLAPGELEPLIAGLDAALPRDAKGNAAPGTINGSQMVRAHIQWTR